MKILYDARYLLVDERFDGVSRYTLGLAEALERRSDTEMTWLISDERQLAKLPAAPHVLVNDPKNALRELFLPRLLGRHKTDVVYSPFFMMGSVGRRYPLILTIHDMIYFHFSTPPYQFSWWIRLGWRLFHLTYWPMRITLNQASAVATVSTTARIELEQARATKRTIATVRNAVDQSSTPPRVDHSASHRIVYMGAFMPYKNPECLIDALANLPDVTLDLMSKIVPERRHELEERARRLGVAERVVFHDGVSDEEYHAALANARCLVTASKIEGFGLPIIEAQQQGIPVVCSDIPIFHEVGAHSVLYFDPDSPLALAAKIQKLADKATNEDFVQRGFDNAKRFTWDASAEQAIALCEQVLRAK